MNCFSFLLSGTPFSSCPLTLQLQVLYSLDLGVASDTLSPGLILGPWTRVTSLLPHSQARPPVSLGSLASTEYTVGPRINKCVSHLL